MPSQKVKFFSEDTGFAPKNKELIRKWVNETIITEGAALHSLNFILCSDRHLLDINRSFLNHDTLTDIITFDTELSPSKISGDIYISIDRVRENAHKLNIPEIDELHRVMIHGVLHLCGYSDKSRAAKAEMTAMEDKYLSIRPAGLIPSASRSAAP